MEFSDHVSAFLDAARQPLIVVLGPTASGKTDFSIRLAKEIAKKGKKAEVVNADSRQLYRHLDIGTAKITPEEMEGVPHHLLDELEPTEHVSIAWYKERAVTNIDRIQVAGSVPLLVGGSMLYISSIIDGLEPLPAVDPDARKMLEEEYDSDGGATSFKKLQELDPILASGMDPKNKRYVVRALELIDATGKTISEQRKTSICPYDLLLIGMYWPRETLTERIGQRTDALFSRGWVEEVEKLKEMGYTAADPAMQSHGYREILAWTEQGKQKEDLPSLKELIAQNTRQYAKRQMTWWRHDPRIKWIDSVAGDFMPPSAAADLL